MLDDRFKSSLRASSANYLVHLRYAIKNDSDELINYLDNLIGGDIIENLADKDKILGWTSAALYEVYMHECKGRAIKPLYINEFVKAIKYLTSCDLKTIRVGGTTKSMFIDV